jgi:hypothetical protein
MQATDIIRSSVSSVTALRQLAADRPELARALSEIKLFQARRFAGSYADLLHTDQYRPAALFFLQELYSERDYAVRDAQFARIAGALERLFPPQVVQTAVALAQLHHLTEALDLAMAEQWLRPGHANDTARYIAAWRAVDQRPERHRQVATVLQVGLELDHLTRTPGLRLMLKLMRGPANLAGLGALQRFLELGFDTFAKMGRDGKGAAHFLNLVQVRETHLLDQLFDADARACEAALALIMEAGR